MTSKLAESVARLVRSSTEKPVPRVGILHRGNRAIVERFIDEGFCTLVFGDHFRTLYSTYQHHGRSPKSNSLFIEVRLDALPIRSGCLDALILTGGLPSIGTPERVLRGLRGLLKEAGLLIWYHPLERGWRGGLRRFTSPRRRRTHRISAREELSATAMKSGFYEVGQIVVPSRLGSRVVTFGRARAKPWEKSGFEENILQSDVVCLK